MVYLVTYDLQAPGQRYDDLLAIIKKEPAWARLGQSAFLVNSELAATELRDKCLTALDGNDKLFVGVVKSPAAWAGMSEEVTSWIKHELL